MALLLNIDTSTSVCSVALSKDGQVVAIKENREGLNHSLLLGTYVDELLKEHHIGVEQLDGIAVSMGPGSYTGLRIGVSLAKGLCFGASKPLIAVNTLQAMAWAVSEKTQDDAWYCPMIDARRMEVYTAFFDRENKPLTETTAEIITEDSFADILAGQKVYFFGNGSDKIKELLQSKQTIFLPDVETSAANLVKIAEERFNNSLFEDVAYFEPFYLKDFIATTPKNKVIGKD